jgi:peptidyl-prolyl cis-trans isomerase C
MMNVAVNKIHQAPEYSYHLLRGALETFQKNIPELNAQQFQKAKHIADKTFALESIVLSTAEARDVVIPDSKLDAAMAEVEGRYTDRKAFLQDLKNNQLDETVLRRALHRELVFDVVMDRISAKTPEVSDIDVQIFYQLHKDRFTKPEKRKARHILITINPEFVENNRSNAGARMQAIVEKLQKNPARFEALAKKHSECPTAVDGGRLGEVERGTLYAELNEALFSMPEGGISPVIETEMGLHVLLCEKITRSITVPLSRARPRIETILQERQRKACQKAWLDRVRGKKDD